MAMESRKRNTRIGETIAASVSTALANVIERIVNSTRGARIVGFGIAMDLSIVVKRIIVVTVAIKLNLAKHK